MAARSNVQTTVTVGMDVQLAKRNAEALKEVVATLKKELKEQRAIMESPVNVQAYTKAEEAVKKLTMQIQTLQKVQKSATPVSAYESYISGDQMNSNTLRQAQRGARSRLSTVRYGDGDAETRQFINDTNAIQKQLNRLQAGFSSPFKTIKNELKNLSGGELQRLHQLLQQEQPLVKGNEKAWANYSAAISKVEERIREYDTIARQQAGAATLSKAQKGGFISSNERDIQRAIDKLREYRAVINDPDNTGKAVYEATGAEIRILEGRLDALKQAELEAAGKSMSLASAMQTGYQSLNGTFTGTTQQLQLAKKALEENLLTARRGSSEYNSIKRSLAGVELELKKVSELSAETQAVLDKPKGKSMNELRVAVAEAEAKLASMRTETKEDEEEFKKLSGQVKAAKKEIKALGGESSIAASSFHKAWSRLKTYVGLYMGAAVAIQKLVATMGDMMQLSDKMGEVRKTTGMTADEVGRLSDSLESMDTRRSLVDLMDLASMAGSIGLKSQQDIEGFTKAANQLTVALPEMGNESARTLMKISKATGDLQKNGNDVEGTLQRVGSTIIALRANSASAAGPITDFVSRVGAVGAQAGISIDQIAALGSTIDALGGRVEMSATALSRMIPAIRNNMFSIANAINMTEKELKGMTAMEQMVTIFRKLRESVRGIDTTTEEGQAQMADNIEAVLGKNATMAEVMKELNQQGARAGIVFGLLSQNVDELEMQLGVASDAYRENTALLNEYNNMNETTAAKWARLKNQIEEAYVSDKTQRTFGKIIDALRWIVNLLTGELSPGLNLVGVAIKTIVIAAAMAKIGFGGAFKSMLDWVVHLRTSIVKLTASLKAFYAANKANIWFAIATAILYAGKALYDWSQRLNKASNALAEAEANLVSTTREAGMLFSKFSRLTKKQDDLSQSTKTLKDRESELSKETENLRKKLGEGAEQSSEFKKKQEELSDAHREVAEAEKEALKTKSERLKIINEINSKYSAYLGYMLSEASTAETVASAHDLIVASLKEEMYWREQNKSFETITEQHSKNLKSYRESSLAELNGLDVMRQQSIMSEWQAMLSSVTFDAKQGGFIIPGAEKAFNSIDEAMRVMKERFDMVLSNEGGYRWVNPSDKQSRLNDWWGESGAGGWGSLTRWTDRGFKDWTREALEVVQEAALLSSMSGSAAQRAHNHAKNLATVNTAALIRQAEQRGDNVSDRQLAEAVVGIQKNISKYSELVGTFQRFAADTSLQGIANVLLKDLPETTRKAVEAEMERIAANGAGPTYSNQSTNPTPYGNYNPITSPYQDWNADALVARRKEMLVRVRALANGADVQAVLSEDAKFITEATRNNIKTTRQAIDWYNEERLKIQEALHEKYLTNTGDWMDPKNGRGRKPKFYESDYALAELDRYYSRRKEALEKARQDESMTEELFNREVELLEQEHLEKRSELRQTFTADSSEQERRMVKDFRKWWKHLSDLGELEEVPWKTVEHEWSVATDAQIGQNNLKAQKDLTELQAIVVRHMNAIAKIIDKERPYDNITANLRDNLTKMDILFADFQKNGPTEDISTLVAAGNKRLRFLLGEAENAYTSTVEEVLTRMGKAGLTAWAEEIRNSPEMQNALMAQLQNAYDEIQDAIKKEATLIKKQTDIWWSDIESGKSRSRKGVFEAELSRLGLSEDQVKRANSLIGAGEASQRVVDRLAIKQMQVQLSMQETYYNRMRKIGEERIAQLRAQGKEEDAQHLQRSLHLSLSKEQVELDKQRVAIANQLDESQNRLYTELKSWADLLSSSLQSVFEASNAGLGEYYNDLARMRLTGEGSEGGTYVVTENAGTIRATAHYERLGGEAALLRQLEIEQQNAVADAWKKVMDDINQKMSETITDQLNAMMQNSALSANTDALNFDIEATRLNTEATNALTGQLSKGLKVDGLDGKGEGSSVLLPGQEEGFSPAWEKSADVAVESADIQTAASAKVEEALQKQFHSQVKAATDANREIEASTQSTFAKMTQAANMYGIAYQAMSNENLSATQKFEMMALQAVGNYALSHLTMAMANAEAKAATDTPGVLGTLWKTLGPAAAPVFAIFTGLLGGLMGVAASRIAKSKAEISQATGVSNSAGRLATGMLTYAAGNVNEFTDPSTLTPGRKYDVDASDGHTYKARYMGANPSTHLTNGPEFHLVGEEGREAIIDAKTTRLLQMDDTGIWKSIQTLYNGGSIATLRRRPVRRGIAAFAGGNLDDFGDMGDMDNMEGLDMSHIMALLDRNSAIQEALLERLKLPISAVVSPHGKGGIVYGYDHYKKEAMNHGLPYIDTD